MSFKNKFKKIFINSGFKNIFLLSSGVLLAHLITIVCQPIVTRLYTPGDLGMLSIVISIVSILTPLMTLQYHMGIVISKTEKEANVLCALTLITSILMCIIISIGLVIYNRIFPTTFKEVGIWIYSVIPLLLLSGTGRVLDSYNNRFEQYKLMSSIALRRSIASNLIKISLGLFNGGLLGLIIAQFTSIVFGIRKQAQHLKTKKTEIFSSTFKEMKSAAVKYKIQPLFSMPGIFVTMFSYSILPIFISSLYGVEQTGYFYLSMSMLGVPLSLVSDNVAKVFFRKATVEKERSGNFFETFRSTAFLLTIVSVIGFTVLWFISEPMFSFVFGQEWLRSGTFVKILVPMFAIRFIVTALMHGFIISGRQLLKLVLQSLFIIEVLVIYIIVKSGNLTIEYFLTLINYSYFLNYVLLFIVLYFTSKKNEIN